MEIYAQRYWKGIWFFSEHPSRTAPAQGLFMVYSLSEYTCLKMNLPWLRRTYLSVGFTDCILFLQELLSCTGLVHGLQANTCSIMVSSAVCREISTVVPEALPVPPFSLTLVSDSYFLYYLSHSWLSRSYTEFWLCHCYSCDQLWLGGSTAETAGTGWNQLHVAQHSAWCLIRDKLWQPFTAKMAIQTVKNK